MREEIVIALAMLAVLLAGGAITKNQRRYTPLILLLSAIAGSLAAGMGLRFREIVEGPFGFLDAMLSVLCGMVFLRVLHDGGALGVLFSRAARRKSRGARALCLMLFMALPGMLSGSALAGILISGPLVRDELRKAGVHENKVGQFVVVGAFLGMMLPPACIPAMVAANGAGSVLPTPYTGFFLPLLALTLPAFLAYWLLAARRVMPPAQSRTGQTEETRAGTSLLCLLPLLLVLAAVTLENLFPAQVYLGGMPVICLAGSLLSMLLPAKKRPLRDVLTSLSDGAADLLLPVASVFALGAVIEVSSMTGLRGLFSAAILPYAPAAVMLALMGLMLPAGLALAFPLAGWLAAYAVFPIGWMANAVMVAGCSAALGAAVLLAPRGGILTDARERLGLNASWRGVMAGAWLPLTVLLACGVCFVLFGDALRILIV